MQRFHDVTIFANNVAELRAFYQKAGFEMAFSDGDKLVVFHVGQNELAIHTSEQRPMQSVGLTILVEDMQAMASKLREQGIAFEGPNPVRPGLSGIVLKDPNQNVVVLLRPD